jgi:heme/copper-type cytochrome/quinol oxidase subunit 2
LFPFPRICMRTKISAAIGVSGLFLLTACSGGGTVSQGTATDTASSDANGAMMAQDSSTTASMPAQAYTPPTLEQLDGARIVEITAADWQFSPNVINVKQGEKLVIHLKSTEGTHSFGSVALGLNVPVSAGETKDIVIPTDKAGTFDFRCMIPCGPGHRDMTGQIIVS